MVDTKPITNEELALDVVEAAVRKLKGRAKVSDFLRAIGQVAELREILEMARG